jgi:hypothetical protein
MKLLQSDTWQAGKIEIEIKAKEPMPSRTKVDALKFSTSGSRDKLLLT